MQPVELDMIADRLTTSGGRVPQEEQELAAAASRASIPRLSEVACDRRLQDPLGPILPRHLLLASSSYHNGHRRRRHGWLSHETFTRSARREHGPVGRAARYQRAGHVAGVACLRQNAALRSCPRVASWRWITSRRPAALWRWRRKGVGSPGARFCRSLAAWRSQQA